MLNSACKKFLTDIIKKEMIILGPSITIFKTRKIKGITVMDDGTVTQASGDLKEITTQLINEFTRLSDPIVINPLQSILANYPSQTDKNSKESKKSYFM